MAVPPGLLLLLLLSLQVQCVTSKTTSVKPDDTIFSISTMTTPTEVLTNISSLTVVNVTKSTISIQWEAAPCSCRYRIEYRIVSNSWNNISNTMNKTYLLENLEADQDYNITVFNENSTQDGTQLSLINNTAPSGLESLSVRAVNTSFVNVTWKYVTGTNMDGKTYITLNTEKSKPVYSSNKTNLNMTMTVLNISSIPGTEVKFYAYLKRKTWPGSVMTASGHTQPAKPRLRVSKSKTNMLEMNVTVDGIFTNYTIEVVGLSDKVFINSTNVTGLESGRNYILTAYSSIGNEISEKANVTATTVPADIDGITLDRSRSNKTTLTAKWEYKKSRDTFEVISTLLNNGTLQTQLSKNKNTNDTLIILTGLIPGGKYNVCVIAKTSNLSSNRVCNQTVLCPSLPQNLKARTTTTTSITLTWTHDDTSIIRGWIIYYANVSVNISEGTINYTFKNLTSGTKYNFTVEPFTDDGVKCGNETLMATVKPTCLLKLEEKNTTNVSVVLTANSSNSEYDNYIFYFASHQGSENFTTLTNETLRFTDRLPGTTYTISVRTVKDSEDSDICTEKINITTNPNRAEVANVVLMSQNISLLLKSPNSTLIDLYFVSYFVENENKTVNTTNSSVLLAPLEPYTNYSITFWVQTNGKNSEKTVSVYATKQDAPAAVRDIVCSKIGSHSLRVTWSAPAKANGEILNYVVSHYKIMKNDSSKKNETDLSSNLTNLSPGSNYHISVTALTVQYGVENTTVCYLNTSAPSYRNGYVAVNSTPTKGDFISPHSFSITLYPAFSDDHGEIIKYFVIVTTNSNDKPNENVSVWSHTNRQKTYRAAVLDKNFFWSSKRSTDKKLEEKKFTIGVDTNCKETQPCNGPLEPATGYHVKFRAINKDSYADTEYSKKIWTLESPKSVPTTVIAVVVVLAMAVILVALALLLYRRRKKSELLESISSRTCILKPSSHPVKLSEFKNHVALMASDSDFRFAEEYEDLKEVGRDQSCTAAELPENRSKNRFTNILPYDHSRVKLVPADDDDGSDYINANYIPGYNFKREYIATQGPLRSTRDDFWRMVWEQNSRNIVMLTRCLEKHKEKCDHYWPENGEPMFYGDLQVSTLNETIFPDWVITEFNISLGEQSKQLRHFHYTAWPDFGVPENPQSLIRFVKTVREKLFSDMGPIIVHCSAGVGRSGTFIGLDSMLHYIDNGNETVDVLGVVHEMRKHRCYMVQTEQQYICLHDCILCVLEGNDDDMVYENFEQDQPRDNVCQGQDNKAYEDDEGINLEMA